MEWVGGNGVCGFLTMGARRFFDTMIAIDHFWGKGGFTRKDAGTECTIGSFRHSKDVEDCLV